MYGKIMSLPDSAMPQYFKLLLQYSPSQLARLEEDLRAGSRHPRDTKMQLAREIVGIFHGESPAARAEEEFRRIFQEGQAPQEMASFALAPGAVLIDVLVSAGMAGSKSQAKRLVAQGGVRIDGEPAADPMQVVALSGPAVLQVGKRGFVRLIPAGSTTSP
jgi:tyrosyl-tRNA synthetase